jgi:hypothetical protein
VTALEPPVPVHDPDEVRRVADAVLAGDRFAEPPRSLVERFAAWLGDLWDRLFPDADPTAFDAGGGGSGGSSAVTVVVLVLAVVLLALLVRALRGTWKRSRRADGHAAALDVDVEGRRSAAAWDDLARRLEAEGRWKDAMRARFGSLVERLVDRGVVDDVPGRTSGEYRGEVGHALPDAADDFAAAAELFERAWYGDLPTGPDEAGRFTEGAERVLAAAGARR